MISIHVMLCIFIILFAIIGAMRGWAKEILVTFSVILSLFTLNVFQTFVPFFKEVIEKSSAESLFWIRTGIVTALVFFGYQTPKLQRLAESGRFMRNVLQDTLLGGVLGAVNGYMVFGTIWYFLHNSGYPFPFVSAPDPATANGLTALTWINFLPPSWLLGNPAIYFAVAICFIFIVVVFI